MEAKDFIFDKIRAIEGTPEGKLAFKNNNIYFDHLNLTWLSQDTLRGYGVSAALALKFSPFYGWIGEEAKTAAKKTVSVSKDDIRVLFKASILISTQEVADKIGGDFQYLPNEVKAVLVSLYRYFGGLSQVTLPALAMASKMLVRGHIKLAVRYLEDKNGWSSESDKSMPIRKKEVALLKSLLMEGE
jgi:hypothetical protein